MKNENENIDDKDKENSTQIQTEKFSPSLDNQSDSQLKDLKQSENVPESEQNNLSKETKLSLNNKSDDLIKPETRVAFSQHPPLNSESSLDDHRTDHDNNRPNSQSKNISVSSTNTESSKESLVKEKNVKNVAPPDDVSPPSDISVEAPAAALLPNNNKLQNSIKATVIPPQNMDPPISHSSQNQHLNIQVPGPTPQSELQERILQAQHLRMQQTAMHNQQQIQAQMQAQARSQAQARAAQAHQLSVQRTQQQNYNNQRKLHFPNPSANRSRMRNYYDGQESDEDYNVDASDGDDHSLYEPSNDEITDDEGGAPRDDEDADLMSDTENLAEELREPVMMPEPVLSVITSDNEYVSDFAGDSGNDEYRYTSDQDDDDDDDDEFENDEQLEIQDQNPAHKRPRIQ